MLVVVVPFSMSRAPAVRFPPPVLGSAPPSSFSSYATRSSPVLYDSDEDAAPFQLIPSPEHLKPPLSTSDASTRSTSSRAFASSHRPIQHLYEEEEDLVSPSSSYTMSPSTSLDQLSAAAASREEQRHSHAEATPDEGRGGRAGPSRRSARQRQAAALRLDLLDADEEESLEGEEDGSFDEEADDQPSAGRRLVFSTASDSRQPQTISAGREAAGATRSTASALSVAIQSAPQRSAVPASSSSSFHALPSTSFISSSDPHPSAPTASLASFKLSGGSPLSFQQASATAMLISSPVRITQPSLASAAVTSVASSPQSSLPSTSFDDFGHLLSVSSLREAGHARLTRSSRDEEDEDDDGDVIELEDDERGRDSSGHTPAQHSRLPNTTFSTPVRASSTTTTIRTPPRTPVAYTSAPTILSSASVHPSSSSSSTLSSSSSTSSVRVPRVASSSTSSLLAAAEDDGGGEDDEDEHNDQLTEERDDLASSIIELSNPQDQLSIRSFTSSQSGHSLAATATSLTSPSSSSSAPSHLPRHARTPPPDLSSDFPIPFSPPTSGGDDDYNDGNVMIVKRSTSLSDPQQSHTGGGTDEEEEADAHFTLGEKSSRQLLSHRPSSAAASLSHSSPSPSVKSASCVVDDDGLAEAKQRREKIHEKSARRLLKKAQRESERLLREQQDRSAEVEDDNIIVQSEQDRRRHQSSIDEDEEQTDTAKLDSDESDSSNEEDDDEDEEGDEDDADEADFASSSQRPSGSRALLGLGNAHAGQSAQSSPASLHKSTALFSSSASASSGGGSPSLSLTRHYSPSPPSRDELSRREARHERRSSRQLVERAQPEAERDESDAASPLTPSRQTHRSRDARTGTARSESKEREVLGQSPSLSRRASGVNRKKKRGSEDEIQYSDLMFGEKIGEGAYGDVFRGYLWGQEVAIKQIRLEKGEEVEEVARVREFRKEMKIMRQLRHPNVVEYLGSCVTGHSLCLLTEYLVSGSLEDQLLRLRREGKRMRVQRVVGLAMDVAKGLNWLHHKGIIHRDLKSANILITEAGRAKISDFGLSHVRRRHEESMVGYHGLAGSPSYIAPEVLQLKEYGVAADVYSFGILLNEMLSGVVPYDDTPLAQLELDEFERRVIAGQRPLLAHSECQALVDLVEECWRAMPTQRPTVEELMKRLERIDKALTAAASNAPLLDAAISHSSTASTSSSTSSVSTALSALDDLPLPLRSLLASDYARLFSLQQALAEQERQLRETSAAMQSEKAARDQEQRQWEEKKAMNRREEKRDEEPPAHRREPIAPSDNGAAGSTAAVTRDTCPLADGPHSEEGSEMRGRMRGSGVR